MRIVVKVGTNLITKKDGSLDRGRIRVLAGEFAALKRSGCQMVLVTSGAIGAGMGKIGLKERPTALREKQALAAIGQPLLMDAYQQDFSAQGLTIAQVLVTRQDFDDRTRYINARNTMLSLLELGVIPIINENDTVAVEEIKFGENDTLAALVAAKISADWVFLFTDVDGLYRGIPGKSDLIPVVEKITAEIESYATGVSGSGKGSGGMKTKLDAAKIAIAAGVRMVIANGAVAGAIEKVLKGGSLGTVFLPHRSLEPRKCWIAFGARCRGRLTVDDGAAQALTKRNKSLLPSGITAVEGKFKVGDTVSVCDTRGTELARGLANYSAQDVEIIKGKRTSELQRLLDHADFEEVIHRDNLVIL